MSFTRSIRRSQIEVGILTHNGREYAAYGAAVSGRQITGYVKQHRGGYRLTRWDGGTMLSCRCEVVKTFWCGALALMFRLPKGKFIVGYALGDDGMLFRGELLDNCSPDDARSLAWAIADHLAEMDPEDAEPEVVAVCSNGPHSSGAR
jgi:hypothetical protein